MAVSGFVLAVTFLASIAPAPTVALSVDSQDHRMVG